MKFYKTLVSAWIILLSIAVTEMYGQPIAFEGIITYSDSLIAKRADLIDENQLNRIRGNQHKFYYKAGSFKITTNGTPSSTTIYKHGDSVSYTLKAGIDTLYVNSIQNESRSLDTIYFSGEKKEILDRETIELIIKSGGTTYSYWVDKSLAVNPDLYKQYRFGFLNEYYSHSKSLYLAQKYESWIFRIESVAQTIEHMRLEDSVFNIPDYPQVRLDLKKR